MSGSRDPKTMNAHAMLVAAGLLEPLSKDAVDCNLWFNCEVVALVENRFFEDIDPTALTRDQFNQYYPKIVHEGEVLTEPHGIPNLVPYWIKHEDQRVGILALATNTQGSGLIELSSLFILRQYRGKGIGSQIIQRTHEALCAHGKVGLSIATHWTWQKAVRFYLFKVGAYVWNWKHSLVFALCKGLPPYRLQVDAERASFDIVCEAKPYRLFQATRRGDQLRWRSSRQTKDVPEEAYMFAPGTFALGLAVHGWPLIRSEKHWQNRHWSSESGDPEGLAHRIEAFEALDRKSGFIVRTPRIPKITYRDWDDID